MREPFRYIRQHLGEQLLVVAGDVYKQPRDFLHAFTRFLENLASVLVKLVSNTRPSRNDPRRRAMLFKAGDLHGRPFRTGVRNEPWNRVSGVEQAGREHLLDG